MVWDKHDYDDIPGTYVFNGEWSTMGYPLNKMCRSFNNKENREAFKADEAAYCDKYGLSPEQKKAVLERDWVGMLNLGGSIYFAMKLASATGRNVQEVGATMSGRTVDEFKAFLASQA